MTLPTPDCSIRVTQSHLIALLECLNIGLQLSHDQKTLNCEIPASLKLQKYILHKIRNQIWLELKQYHRYMQRKFQCLTGRVDLISFCNTIILAYRTVTHCTITANSL